MAVTSPAIDRELGKADTDDNGLARYTIKIETPAGIKSGNQPDLSLQYSQGTPNGILGFSWVLGGVSSIHLGAPKVVYGQVNPPPSDYDTSQPKLIMDGIDLLNIQGKYNDDGTIYTTEIDNTGLRVQALGVAKGFIVTDNMGHRSEYGTTDDSRTTSQGQNQPREWRIKSQSDCHGNTVQYNYVVSPQGPGTKDLNTSYLQSIQYCFNKNTTAPPTRYVEFQYSDRPDLVTQSIEGAVITWAHRLSSILIGVNVGGATKVNRKYSLNYGQSATTGDSCLTEVVESSDVNGQTVNLLPTSFGYTTQGVDPNSMFQTVAAAPFASESNIINLLPMNMTGKALTDLACVAWDGAAKTMTFKTYMAQRKDAAVEWSPSATNVSVNLPMWADTQPAEMPDFLTPDLHGDGRSDLIVPYKNAGGNLEFFLSQSNGVALTEVQQRKVTNYPWTPKSKFMAMDMTGTGIIDVVQIYPNDQNQLCFRNFPGVANDSGNIGLSDAIETGTQSSFDNTIDWFLLKHSGTGAVSLVRVFQVFSDDQNSYFIRTKSYQCKTAGNSSQGFNTDGPECVLGGPFPKGDGNTPLWSVLSCDINGDGTQDIVLAKAQFNDPNMTFTYRVSLGNGLGSFAQQDQELTQTIAAVQPKGDGRFSVTNLNGGLYPALAYVYQQNSDSNFVCFSVNGLCNGTVSSVVQYHLTGDPGISDVQVLPTDISGIGMGGWLFYSLTGGKPSIVPVYNTGQATDLLSAGNNSMGLVTAFSYGCLTDPAVYDSGVDWQNYPTNRDYGSYIVQGAPNYVVTSLKHTNDTGKTSSPFEVIMQKKYRQAVVNSQGRGWLGFESITTNNVTDTVCTVEHYFQTFPKVGLKSHIDTLGSDGAVLSSRTTDYETVDPDMNGWYIYHVNKTFDQVVTEGDKGRVQRSDFGYDDDGNIISKHSAESHGGNVIFESWEKCSYTSINGITSLLTGKKLSSKDGNQDLNKFEPGDLNLTQYTFNSQTALLDSVKSWSSDIGQWLVTQYQFDRYGNECSTNDPAGLVTTTTYDATFMNLAIMQEEKGPGVHTIHYTAYDQASGKVVAKRETDGQLTCSRLDGFGRTVESRMPSKKASKLSVSARDFLNQPYVASAEFTKLLLGEAVLDPVQRYSYDCFTSPASKPYITSSLLSYYDEGDSGQHEIVNVVDCVQQKRMERSRQGVDPAGGSTDNHVLWRYWNYDSRGNATFESFDLTTVPWNNFEYSPSPGQGTTSVFDTLGRVLTQTRPSHNDPAINVVSSLQYSVGGGTVLETINGPNPNLGTQNVVLWSEPRSYVSIDGKEHLLSSTNPGGLITGLSYDVAGNLVAASDPSGKKETRQYNSLGQLLMIDNVYQNVPPPNKSPSQPAMTYEYDGTGQLIKTVNANGEVISFTRDSKGRPTSKTGFDGRMIEYEYDTSGLERLLSMTVFPLGKKKPFETKLSFEYDERARLSSRKLTFANDDQYETRFEYDWQGQVISKSFPDGSIKVNKYMGALLSYSKISNGASGGQEKILLDSTFEYGAFAEKPSAIGFKQADSQVNFQHKFVYDLQSYPVSHSLSRAGPSPQDNKTLVQEDYVYNGADQIAQRQRIDELSTLGKRYNYDGRRLQASDAGNGNVSNYAYDPSGNLTTKGDISIAYGSDSATGKRGNVTAFDIKYDRAGRMVSRATAKSTLDFQYDSFGLLASYSDGGGKATKIVSGPDGKTVVRSEKAKGRFLLLISDDFNVQKQKDGTTITTLKLFGAGILLGSFSKTDSRSSSGSTEASAAVFTDNKGNVTHRFKGADAQLLESITYDDFGTPMITSHVSDDSNFDKTSTYESKALDETSELFDFGSRWYDPLCGRFTTPDDILSVKDLARTDGLNRLAFENNDPINHADPTGHWSLSAIFGAVIGAVMVVGAAVLTVATGGAATPLLAAAVGALAGGGIAGIKYSFDHRNERGGKFWGGYAATVLVNAGIGAASGYLGAVATPARLVSPTGRLGEAVARTMGTAAQKFMGSAASVGSKALISATASLTQTVSHNAIENTFYGAHNGLFDGAGKAFATGALAGAAAGAYSAVKPASAAPVTMAEKLKKGLPGGLLVVGKAGALLALNEKVPERAGRWASREKAEMKNLYQRQQSNFLALSSMVGPSGLVGTLHNDLVKHQSVVNYG